MRSLVTITCLVLLSALSLPSAVGAVEAEDRLRAFLGEVSSLRAEFTQTVLDAAQQSLQQASGVLLMKRPGLFRWDYSKPYVQQVVADGERVWMYDADLEQVTVRPQSGALDDTPAMLLSGASNLDRYFEIENLSTDKNGLQWVRLRPKKKESNFEQIRLGFGKELERMDMVDLLGQTTQFHFQNLQRNPALETSRFRFIIPEGVDVIGGS